MWSSPQSPLEDGGVHKSDRRRFVRRLLRHVRHRGHLPLLLQDLRDRRRSRRAGNSGPVAPDEEKETVFVVLKMRVHIITESQQWKQKVRQGDTTRSDIDALEERKRDGS